MNTNELLVIYAGALVAFFIGMYYFLRFVFSLKRQLWNQQATIKLLIMLVEKQLGVSEEVAHLKELNSKNDD